MADDDCREDLREPKRRLERAFEGFRDQDAERERLRRFVSPRMVDEDECEDAVSETLVICWQRGLTYDPSRSFFGFHANWARYVAMRHARKRGDRSVVERMWGELEEAPEVRAQWKAESEVWGEAAEWLEQPQGTVEDRERAELADMDALLHHILSGAHPPHQAIIYVFRRALGLQPQEVVAKYPGWTLAQLAEEMEREYVAESRIPDETLRLLFAKFRRSLQRPLGKLITNPRARQALPQDLNRIAGEFLLSEFLGLPTNEELEKQAAEKITSWWWSVHRRVDGYAKRKGLGKVTTGKGDGDQRGA
jgi:DNA-directed RNA polymerase specialized sigma24 family protein